MTFLSSLASSRLFGGTSADHDTTPQEVVVETLGREHSGKTGIKSMIFKITQDGPLTSGLELSAQDPRTLVRLMNDAIDTYRGLQHAGFTSTIEPEQYQFHLYEADQVRAVLNLRESIGQLLTFTNEDSERQMQEMFRKHHDNLSKASVIHVHVSCPADDRPESLERLKNDLAVLMPNLRLAIGSRNTHQKVAVAVIVTKPDGAYSAPDEARAALPDERLRGILGRLVGLLEGSPRVGLGALFVTSAFGYGKARRLESASDRNGNGSRQRLQFAQPGRTRMDSQVRRDARAAQPDCPDLVDHDGRLGAQEGRPSRRGNGPNGQDAIGRPEGDASLVRPTRLSWQSLDRHDKPWAGTPSRPTAFSTFITGDSMNEPILIFETDPAMGTPRVLPANGTAKSWNQRELRLLEDQLRSRYESLVREGTGTIEFKGQKFHVKRKDGDVSRQPTLELRQANAPEFWLPGIKPEPLPAPASAIEPTLPTNDWYTALLAEIGAIINSEEMATVEPAERANLRVVAEELSAFRSKSPPRELALLMLTSILLTADHLIRTRQPGKATHYAIALGGIERLLSHTSMTPRTPWGPFPATPNKDPAPGWLGNLWGWLTGS